MQVTELVHRPPDFCSAVGEELWLSRTTHPPTGAAREASWMSGKQFPASAATEQECPVRTTAHTMAFHRPCGERCHLGSRSQLDGQLEAPGTGYRLGRPWHPVDLRSHLPYKQPGRKKKTSNPEQPQPHPHRHPRSTSLLRTAAAHSRPLARVRSTLLLLELSRSGAHFPPRLRSRPTSAC